MSLKVPNKGELELLTYILNLLPNYATLKLFKNDITPADDHTEVDFTEADFPGYSSVALDQWSAPVTNAQGKAETSEDTQTFTFSGTGAANDIYGYFVVSSDNGNILWAERDPDAPVTLDTDGQTYKVKPKLTLKSEV